MVAMTVSVVLVTLAMEHNIIVKVQYGKVYPVRFSNAISACERGVNAFAPRLRRFFV